MIPRPSAYSLLPLVMPALAAVAVAQIDRSRPTDGQILAWLRELQPLPKVHYSFPLPSEILTPANPFLYELARITHAVSISGEWAARAQIDAAVMVCKRVNDTKPRIPATIAINYSPWHRRFGKDLPPTDTGKSYREELDVLWQRLSFVKDRIARTNRMVKSDVRVSAILFDCERFSRGPGDSGHNAAITRKLSLAYDRARKAFPTARIEWYNRGGITPAASSTGWRENHSYTLQEKGDSFSCALYRVPEIETTRETMRRTVKNARAHGVEEVTPWVALASGYRRQVDAFQRFDKDWNYDLIYSWSLGAQINHPWHQSPERERRFAPWAAAKVVVFYPAPFNPKSPHWGVHFVAYVRGSHLIRALPGQEGRQLQSAPSQSRRN